MNSLLLSISSESYSTKGFGCHFDFLGFGGFFLVGEGWWFFFLFGYFVDVVVVYCFLSCLQKCVNFPNKPVLNTHQSLDIPGTVRAKTWAFASHTLEL